MLYLTLSCSVSLQATAPIDEIPLSNPLVGVWTWTRDINKCMETYTYKADGTLHVVSGEEISDSQYELSMLPTAAGFYVLTDKIIKDFGGRDCADDETNSTGDQATNYIYLNPEGNMYYSCKDEGPEKCFGPLIRVDK